MELLILVGGMLLMLSCACMALAEAVYAFSIGVQIAADAHVLSIPAAITNNFL